MSSRAEPPKAAIVLGVECGGTRTVALAADAGGRQIRRAEFGPANLRLLSDRELTGHFKTIAARMPSPSDIAIGMAGARTEHDRNRIRVAASKSWPGVACFATNDLETALLAAPPSEKAEAARILILSGTGSCCFGKSRDGKTVKIGGWGHILGDKGSGYEIGLRLVKALLYYYDRDGRWPVVGGRVLRALMLNEPNELIPWAQAASKADIAALAVEVFRLWEDKEKIAGDILKAAANSLAKDGAACARRLVRGAAVEFILAGSVLTKQSRFVDMVSGLLRKQYPRGRITVLQRESVWGAVELAKRSAGNLARSRRAKPESLAGRAAGAPDPFSFTSVASLRKSPTEQRHPRSMKLDRMPVCEAIRLMLEEDARIPKALLERIGSIERAVRLVACSLKAGGRLFYVGAGTSGRLGVLDASECPPTFQTPPDMVQGIIAGGRSALWQAVEGAEDNPEAGARAIQYRDVNAKDVVAGIAASGRTPFVWGALDEARRRKAATVLICFNPDLKVPPQFKPDVSIIPEIGPEILTGSTRLKAGTATKLILNILTTLSMVRLGKVMSNLMIDVRASNAKLRDRAARIVCELTGCAYDDAWRALQQSRWQIKLAFRRIRGRGSPRRTAKPFPPRPASPRGGRGR
jgi:N-acetylmuramic acid 6-phosphate etherase